MDVVVRDRVEADLPACVEALRRVHEADDYPREWPADPASWLCPAACVGTWVATLDRDVVGHVVTTAPDAGRAWVSRLFVTPSAQRRGVAAALLEVAGEDARSVGRSLELGVVEESTAAIALYERLGWTLLGREPAPFTWPDGTRPTQRRYRAP